MRIKITHSQHCNPVPMGEMKTGDIGTIAGAVYQDCCRSVGDAVFCIGQGHVVIFDGKQAATENYTVRLLQPGESLTITRTD